MKILPTVSEACPIKSECVHNVFFLTFVTLILNNSH